MARILRHKLGVVNADPLAVCHYAARREGRSAGAHGANRDRSLLPLALSCSRGLGLSLRAVVTPVLAKEAPMTPLRTWSFRSSRAIRRVVFTGVLTLTLVLSSFQGGVPPVVARRGDMPLGNEDTPLAPLYVSPCTCDVTEGQTVVSHKSVTPGFR